MKPKLDILIAEDEPEIREYLTELLVLEGHKVRSAPNGWEAWKELSIRQPDLLITDIMMPVMTGYELIKQIRLREGIDKLPIIYFTASLLEEDELLKTCRYISKPLNIDEMLSGINRKL